MGRWRQQGGRRRIIKMSKTLNPYQCGNIQKNTESQRFCFVLINQMNAFFKWQVTPKDVALAMINCVLFG
jgi:hypothetical protein